MLKSSDYKKYKTNTVNSWGNTLESHPFYSYITLGNFPEGKQDGHSFLTQLFCSCREQMWRDNCGSATCAQMPYSAMPGPLSESGCRNPWRGWGGGGQHLLSITHRELWRVLCVSSHISCNNPETNYYPYFLDEETETDSTPCGGDRTLK